MATARDKLNAYITHQTDADEAKFNALLDNLCAEKLREAAAALREARRMGHLLLVSEEEVLEQMADEAQKSTNAQGESTQAADRIVAYRNPDQPSVLLCLRHGDGWWGLTPLMSEDVPDGGGSARGATAAPTCSPSRIATRTRPLRDRPSRPAGVPPRSPRAGTPPRPLPPLPPRTH